MGQGHDVYGEGGYGGYQKSGGHQQIGNPDRGQHAEEYHQESGQSRYQQPKGYQQAGGHEQADGRGYEQGRLRYGQSHSGYESERYGREQSQGGYRYGQGNPQQGHETTPVTVSVLRTSYWGRQGIHLLRAQVDVLGRQESDNFLKPLATNMC